MLSNYDLIETMEWDELNALKEDYTENVINAGTIIASQINYHSNCGNCDQYQTTQTYILMVYYLIVMLLRIYDVDDERKTRSIQLLSLHVKSL